LALTLVHRGLHPHVSDTTMFRLRGSIVPGYGWSSSRR
jgi:hypothetical protein